MELRDAIIDFLELKKGKDDPRWEEIKVQPMVLECTRKALPNFVSLEEWLHRRQRLNRGISAWPPPQPVWLLEPHERWKKDPPLEPVPLPHTGRFQRRDSTQRRGSSVFGINFTVTDHGHIFGALAGLHVVVSCHGPAAQ
ncbi:unnamed protein product [Durusdinium trenchii]|uniref:Uncharacterized protein n=1 Tax=Durusdinium trenchii TaxID=1381693 RepID=A0ABP0H781_9DINO